MSRQYLSRREWLAATGGVVTLFGGASIAPAAYPRRFVQQISEGLTPLWRAGGGGEAGGFAWESESEPHVTPTFAVVGCYRLLGLQVPNRERVISFLHKYPVPERRRTERPLWTFDYQQVQSLRWLDADISDFRQLASTWTGPSKFPTTLEAGGNPVFQFQVAAVRTRSMLGIASEEPSWRQYFVARRRPNGTFNNIPAIDDATGHVMNTWWGLLAMDAIGETKIFDPTGLLAFVQACQGPGGGFIYAPDAEVGAVEDAGYTWAALNILNRLGAEPVNKAKAIEFLQGLRADDGLFRETADGRPNPLGTWYVLESLALLGHTPTALLRGPAVQKRAPVANDLRVWTMQIEAPGKGSPEEAVTVAEATGIHIWAARNPELGWLEAAQSVADRRKVPVLFAPGVVEYGTLITVPGLGTYNHLSAFCAPPGKDYGKAMSTKIDHTWNVFRDRRILAVKAAGGRMIWQFNDNEELTRILLDEAVQVRTYAAISTFHLGDENFLASQPWLQRWYGRLPFVSLQDSHHAEPWWSFEQLAGFRTLFIAKEPTWDGWLAALDRHWVLGVRGDRFAGGTPEVRDFVTKQPSASKNRPLASIVVLRPGMKFEAGAPASGTAIRVRLAAHHTPEGQPREPLVTLSELLLDGNRIDVQAVETNLDRYLLAPVKITAGPHTVVARLVQTDSKQPAEVKSSWVEPG